MRNFIVDTIATIVFFTTAAALTELFIVGLAPAQVLMARLISIPVMILTGRPYGMWRDWVFSFFPRLGRWGAIPVDIFAFLLFQVPIYVAILAVAGADRAEMMAAVGSAIVFMVILSRPFGLFLEAMRRLFGLQNLRSQVDEV